MKEKFGGFALCFVLIILLCLLFLAVFFFFALKDQKHNENYASICHSSVMLSDCVTLSYDFHVSLFILLYISILKNRYININI